MSEVVRLQNLPCMQYVRYETDSNGNLRKYKYDFPKFMKHTRQSPRTKDGDALPYEVVKSNNNKLKNRINPEFVCPMNWSVDCLADTKLDTKARSTPTESFFVKVNDGKVEHNKITRTRELIKEYIEFAANCTCDRELSSFEAYDKMAEKMDELYDKVRSTSMSRATVNKIVEISMVNTLDIDDVKLKQMNKKYVRKLLNCMYRTNKRYFLESFVKGDDTDDTDNTKRNDDSANSISEETIDTSL